MKGRMRVETQVVNLTISRPRISKIYPLPINAKVVIPRFKTLLKTKTDKK